MNDPFDEIRRRLESVEAQNRRLRRWGGAALLAALSFETLGLANAQEVPEFLRTDKLEVVDYRGTLRFCLIPSDGQPGAHMERPTLMDTSTQTPQRRRSIRAIRKDT